MTERGVGTFVEVGPGKVLTGSSSASPLKPRPSPSTISRARSASLSPTSYPSPRAKEQSPSHGHPSSRFLTAASPSPASASSARSARTFRPSGTTSSTAGPACTRSRAGIPTPYEAKVAARSTTSTARNGWTSRPSAAPTATWSLGVAAAKQALADSGLEVDRRQPRRHRRDLRQSAAAGRTCSWRTSRSGRTAAPARVSPFFIANMLPDTASGQIAIETGIRGSNMCVVTACSTGTHNIGEAAEGIRRGDYIAAIAGATENPLHELVYIGFSNMRGMGMPRPGEDAADRVTAVRQDAQRLRAGRGQRRDDARGPRVRQGTRREDLRRGRRLRLGGGRVGPHPAGREGRRHPPGDDPGARAPRRAGRRDRPHQPPRHVDAAGRPARGAGHLGRRSAITRPRSRSARPSR